MKELPPLPIGIFLGKTKPADINEYLAPFVNEVIPLLENGYYIKGHFIKIKIRCIICDSPARAFVKSVVNFNGKNGCLKCTINGEYSHVSKTVVFPTLHCPLRTDLKFRQKDYGKHHAGQDSPILKLPDFDMVKDFVVADSLHLLELGVMKRLLTGWRDGSLGYEGKLSALKIQQLSDAVVNVELPKEIHRKMRGLDCLAFWKGTEWHSFLNYVSIVVLKDFIDEKLYSHFLLLFIAVTFKDLVLLAQFQPIPLKVISFN
ncbi:AAEL004424-PA [Aedes aegypti]|uniref:AAEL004424-PA n=1 Tax=Aedes aegypti TaxID=7159 RepID=Q17CV5_AEDAE|nr:AAEL004424-PA [Aedes aegypti]